MRHRTLTAALTAAALIYAPTPVFAQSAPLPAISHESGLQLAGDDGDDDTSRRRRRGLTMWVVAGFVTLLALYVLLHKGHEEEAPTSP
jgi:hypothetical protein